MNVFLEDSPRLPSRIASDSFDLSLFFDFSLRTASDFFNELRQKFRVENRLVVLSSNGFAELGWLEPGTNWGGEIAGIDARLDMVGDYRSLCVVEECERWLILQDLPISLGVALFKSSDPVAAALYGMLSRSEWFFDIERVVLALSNPQSGLMRDYGSEFLQEIIKNYSSKK